MPALAQEVLQELTTRERKLAVCASDDNLSPADRAEILVVLSSDADQLVALHATQALASQPEEAFAEAVKREEALPGLFEYASARFVGTAAIAEAMVENKSCPSKLLAAHVPYLSANTIRALADNLNRVSESSALAEALLQSPSINLENKRTLQELLGPSAPVDQKVMMEVLDEIEPDEVKRVTLLQRLAQMTVSERVQFAIKGGSEARRMLIRDSNKVVQRAVLQSPRLTDQEVAAFAAMTSLTDEILRQIAGNRTFRKDYTVIRNLMNNPKTPIDVTLHMLPQLNALDLKKLTTNKNVADTLRTTAMKLHRTRTSPRT